MSAMLTPGQYILTEDIKNPTPNTRRHDWTAVRRYRAGMRFQVVTNERDGLPRLSTVALYRHGNPAKPGDLFWELIAPRLAPRQ